MSTSHRYVVRNGNVVFPESGPQCADIAVADGRIAAICRPGESIWPDAETVEARGLHIFPGLIDAHVHFGYADPVDEYRTETAHAARGGVTSILAYVLYNESYKEIAAERRAQCEAQSYIDFGFHFGASSEAHITEFEHCVRKFGVNSFKYFMQYKGEEGRYVGLDGTDDGFMYDLMQRAAAIPEALLVVHPENIEVVNRLRKRAQLEGKDTLREYCLSKPPFTEAENMVRAMYFAEHTGCRIYFPHVSCAVGLEETRQYRKRYDRVHLETCPQYLTHTLDSDLGSLGKGNPPLRTRADVDALWAGLSDGTIEVVGSDHVPRKRANKQKGIWQASNGFPGIATILPVLLSEGYHKGRISLQRIAQVFSRNPARIFGISSRKGDLKVGMDADLTIVDLNLSKVVDPSALGSFCDYSIYEGWDMKGWPVRTIVRGVSVMRDGHIVGAQGHGRYLSRPLDP